ncbi:MAG: peptidylprolyl isomerase [Planctomycetes bacterium]|nr:peptidylprolyl isomerase [Planctomycetota bacterium]
MLVRTLLSSFACGLLCLAGPAALPAQGKPKVAEPKVEKPKAGKPAGPVKEDPLTAKDPVVVALDKFRKDKVSTKRADWKTALPAPPLQTFDGKRDYRWHVETDKGTLTVLLLPEAAPMHVTSVIYLARCGFYDGLGFPRILKGFMAQGGSPTNTTSGNAGYTMDGEFLTGAKHDREGTLSAANSGQPNTDGSQFFLTFVPTPHLDGKHTVHGYVTEGLEVLRAIEACGTDQDGQAPRESVTIVRTWITVAPKPPAAPGVGDGQTGR